MRRNVSLSGERREPSTSTRVVNSRPINIILVKTAPTPLTTAEYRADIKGTLDPYNGGDLHIFKTIQFRYEEIDKAAQASLNCRGVCPHTTTTHPLELFLGQSIQESNLSFTQQCALRQCSLS